MCPMGRHFILWGVKTLILKEARTYHEQIVLIRSKGFVIDDEEKCICFLKKANYYRLSAYCLPFKNPDGTFFKEIPIERIQRIYDFDSRLRALLFEIVEEIEFYLRTQFAYFSGHKYGALGYLESKNFSDKHNEDKFHEKVKSCIDDNKNTLVVKHHKEKYDGKFPIWVIIEFFSIGMLSYFYGDMITEDMKKLAKEIYSTSPDHLKSWLRCLTDLRNRCAHYSRLYYWSFTAMPKMPRGCGYEIDRKLFSQLLMLKFLFPERDKWNTNFLIAIKSLLEEYLPDVSLKHIGFPIDWEKHLTIYN